MTKLLFKAGEDWTQELLTRAWEEIEIIAKEELKISYYKPQIEIVTAKQMLDAYASTGMPTFYKHWSFGKDFVLNERSYQAGEMGLAYEMVINSDPCIAYLMEENGAMVQTMVMAHASVGHSAVFKNNYLFKEHTEADFIIDYLTFAKDFIKRCEERYGAEAVEDVLDACHALQRYGVDRYKKPKKKSVVNEEKIALEKFERELQEYDHVWETVGQPAVERAEKTTRRSALLDIFFGNDGDQLPKEVLLSEPQENILYFIEKNAPQLAEWKRELIRINRNLGEYFHPQILTKVLNEGYASFCHYYIMNRLEEKGLIDGGTMLEFFAIHGNVLRQPAFQQFNPYMLGFSIFMDIKRICENPTDEDKFYFPNLIDKQWQDEVNYAMMNFNDETFIQQYLSPKVARDLQLFVINANDDVPNYYSVTEISDENSFYNLRNKLAAEFSIDARFPDIQIYGIDKKGSRKMFLKHEVKRDRPLKLSEAKEVVGHVATLWEYSVDLRTFERESDKKNPITVSALGKYSGTR